MAGSLDLRFPAAPEAVPGARRALGRLEGEAPPGLLDDVRLLVSELLTNSVRHAGLDEDDLIEVRVDWSHAGFRVEVVDQGLGFEPGPPVPSPDGQSGWGLFLVNRIADRWGVDRRDGTRVWFEIDRRA